MLIYDKICIPKDSLTCHFKFISKMEAATHINVHFKYVQDYAISLQMVQMCMF